MDHGSRSTRSREHAERELFMRVLDIVLHELGNPLQGLTLQIEMTRSTLAAAQRDEQVIARGLERLDRGLESIDHVQSVIHRAAALRRLLDDAHDIACDESCTTMLGLLGGWLHRRRIEVVCIDPEASARWQILLPLELRLVVLASLLAAGDLLRGRGGSGARLELCPRRSEDRCELELTLRAHDERPIALPIAPILRASDLLGERGRLVHEAERVCLSWPPPERAPASDELP